MKKYYLRSVADVLCIVISLLSVPCRVQNIVDRLGKVNKYVIKLVGLGR